MSQKLLLLLGGIAIGAAAVLACGVLFGEDLTLLLEREKALVREQRADLLTLTEEKDRLAAAIEKQNEESVSALAKARAEAATLREAVAALEAARPAAPPAEVDAEPVVQGAPTKEEMIASVREFAGTLQSLILSGDTSGVQQLKDTLGRATPEQVAEMYEEFSTTANLQWKTVLAHALAHSGIEGSRDFLLEVAGDSERSFVDRRSATHGLVFTGDATLEPALLQIARTDKDRGVRANASFGVARNGSEEGMRLYAAATDEAFEKKDPAAVAYLSGFSLLGKTASSVVRERLSSPTYAERQTRLMLIGFAKSNKDREAVNALRSITEDQSADAAVKAAAASGDRRDREGGLTMGSASRPEDVL